jgi:hypothetical protein
LHAAFGIGFKQKTAQAIDDDRYQSYQDISMSVEKTFHLPMIPLSGPNAIIHEYLMVSFPLAGRGVLSRP